MLSGSFIHFEDFFPPDVYSENLVSAFEPISWSGGFKKWSWLSLLPSSVKMVWGGYQRPPNKDVIAGAHLQQCCLHPGASKMRGCCGFILNWGISFVVLYYMEIWNPISSMTSRCQTFGLGWKSRPVENTDSVQCRISGTFCLKKLMVVGTVRCPAKCTTSCP